MGRYTEGNIIYHNNFNNNTNQVIDKCNSTFTWDNDYPSGGNYWSDHEFVDKFSGPHQDEPGSDGICDTPYIIDENNKDNYPLVSPYWYWINPMTGDVNKDVAVDMRDIALAAAAFGSYPGHPRWNPIADINKDNKVDMRDLVTVARNFGKTV